MNTRILASYESKMRILAESIALAHAVYQEMSDVCMHERSALKQGDVEALQALLEKKQQLLERVHDPEEQINSLKPLWLVYKREFADSLRAKEIQSLLEAFGSLMKELVDAEEENERILQLEVMRRRQEFNKIRTNRELHQAYSATEVSMPTDGHYMDSKR